MITSPNCPVETDQWLERIRIYGPVGLLIFSAFVLLPFSYWWYHQHLGKEKVHRYILMAVWIWLCLLGSLIAYEHYRTTFPSEYVVRGVITNLKSPQIVETDQDLFLHRHPTAGNDFEYEWRLISEARYTGEIELMLQQRPEESVVYKYYLPILPSSYRESIELKYDRETSEMMVHSLDGTTVLKPTIEVAGEADAYGPALGVVYAASVPPSSPEDLIKALDADDPLIRKNARRDLANQGASAVADIATALANPTTKYRLRLGLLATLQDIGKIANAGLGTAARCSVLRASLDSDPIMQEEAKEVFAKGIIQPSDCPAQTDAGSALARIIVTTDEVRPGDYLRFHLSLPSNEGGPFSCIEVDLQNAARPHSGPDRRRLTLTHGAPPCYAKPLSTDVSPKSLQSMTNERDIKMPIPRDFPPGSYFISHIATYGTRSNALNSHDYWGKLMTVTPATVLIKPPDLVPK